MPESAFSKKGLRESIAVRVKRVQEVYLADEIPWVVGYSGGKDSTAALELTWMALSFLPAEQRHKDVHVIATDTRVENPVVSAWVRTSLGKLAGRAQEEALPIMPHELEPTLDDSFWVNLLGRGYPAPRTKFRWCTERLKIRPSNRFIRDMVSAHGEAIVVLGTRSAESAARANVIAQHRKLREKTGFYLSPNSALENCFIYSPIEDWTNDDVWQFLMTYENPWGHSNRDLLNMYRGATSGGECPLVVDTTTPSCGKSRFGCWVCTLVDEDKSMAAMIANDAEKEWLAPLLDLRNELDFRSEEARRRDRARRDFRRMNGRPVLYGDRLVPGPYTQDARVELLAALLEAQEVVREETPEGFGDISLISVDELREIRRIWVQEKNEIEDVLPGLYAQITGRELPDPAVYAKVVPRTTLDALRSLCDGEPLRYEMIRDLLCTEFRFRTKSRRAGLLDALEADIRKSFFRGAQDAHQWARERSAKQAELTEELRYDTEIDRDTALCVAESGDGQY